MSWTTRTVPYVLTVVIALSAAPAWGRRLGTLWADGTRRATRGLVESAPNKEPGGETSNEPVTCAGPACPARRGRWIVPESNAAVRIEFRGDIVCDVIDIQLPSGARGNFLHSYACHRAGSTEVLSEGLLVR